MIATFCIEIGLAIYTMWRYRQSLVTRLIVLLFVFLAMFQLAEFMVCRGATGNTLIWSQIGYVAITLLPPLGIHLVYAIAGVKKRPLLIPAYIAAAGFMAFFAFVGNAIDGHACLGNYVIFQVAPGSGRLYGAYYYGLLLVTLGLGYYFRNQTKDRHQRRAFTGVMVGYLAFIIPTATANQLSPETIQAIPSVMCGFAILLALILAFVVLPVVAKERT